MLSKLLPLVSIIIILISIPMTTLSMDCSELLKLERTKVQKIVDKYDDKFPGLKYNYDLSRRLQRLKAWYEPSNVINPNSVKKLLNEIVKEHFKLDKIYWSNITVKTVTDKDIINATRKISSTYLEKEILNRMKMDYVGNRQNNLNIVRREIVKLKEIIRTFDRNYLKSEASKDRLKRDISNLTKIYSRSIMLLSKSMTYNQMVNNLKEIVKKHREFNCNIKSTTRTNAKEIENIFSNVELFQWFYYSYIYSQLIQIKYPRKIIPFTKKNNLKKLFYSANRIKSAGQTEFDISDINKIGIQTAIKLCEYYLLEVETNRRKFGIADRIYWIGMINRLNKLEKNIP